MSALTVVTDRERDLAERLAVAEQQRDRMLHALRISRGNVASLGPAGALQPYAEYREWLRMIDEAIDAAPAACPNCLCQEPDDLRLRDEYIKAEKEIERLQSKVAELEETNSDLDQEAMKQNDTLCQQHARIMTLEALIEKCEKALARSVRKLAAYYGICSGDKELTGAVLPIANEALDAIAAHKQAVGHHHRSPDTNGFGEKTGVLVTAIAAQKGGA